MHRAFNKDVVSLSPSRVSPDFQRGSGAEEMQLSESFSKTVQDWERIRESRCKLHGKREIKSGYKKEDRSKSRERDKARQRTEKELQKIEKKEERLRQELRKLSQTKLKLDMQMESSTGSELAAELTQFKDDDSETVTSPTFEFHDKCGSASPSRSPLGKDALGLISTKLSDSGAPTSPGELSCQNQSRGLSPIRMTISTRSTPSPGDSGLPPISPSSPMDPFDSPPLSSASTIVTELPKLRCNRAVEGGLESGDGSQSFRLVDRKLHFHHIPLPIFHFCINEFSHQCSVQVNV